MILSILFGRSVRSHFSGMENEHIVSSFIYMSPLPTTTSWLNVDPTQGAMTAKVSLYHDWHSEDQHVGQSTTDKVTRAVCVSSMGSIGKAISCCGHPQTRQDRLHLLRPGMTDVCRNLEVSKQSKVVALPSRTSANTKSNPSVSKTRPSLESARSSLPSSSIQHTPSLPPPLLHHNNVK